MKLSFDCGYSIVIGGAHFNALGVIRSLGEAGIPSVFINLNSWSNSSYSKYTLDTFFAHDAGSIREAITASVQRYGGKPTVIPTGDNLVLLLESIRGDVESLCYLPGFSDGNAAQYLRKDVMCSLAAKAGFTVPRTILLEPAACSLREEIVQFGFPCILKPVSGTEGAKADISICLNENDLDRSLSCFSAYRRLLVQKYVDSEDAFTIEYCGCKSHGCKTLVYGEMRKIREYPVGRGSTSFARIVSRPEYADQDMFDAFLDAVGFSGIFDLECKVVGNVPYFLEINYRNGAPSYGFTKAGFNIPASWHNQQIGTPVPKPEIRDSLIQCEGIDCSHVFDHTISLGRYFHDFCSADAHMIVNRHDMRPLVSSWRLLKPYIQSKIHYRKR